MGLYILDVPLVGQKTGYDGQPLMQPNSNGTLEQHGFMACWYAAACMVSYYYKPGPRPGLPTLWKADRGLTVAAVNKLAQIENLKVLSKPSGGLTATGIQQLLESHGPIWAAGFYLDDYPDAGHAIVITGVMNGVITYNDPWEPERKAKAATWIESKMLKIPNAMLVKKRRRTVRRAARD